MSGKALSEEPWSSFVASCSEQDPQYQMSSSEWIWVLQTQKVVTHEIFKHLVKSRSNSDLVLEFDMRLENHTLKLERKSGFPEAEPEISGNFSTAFFYDWTENSDSNNVLNLTSRYRQFCESIEDALSMFKEYANEDYKLIGVKVDDDDPECLIAEYYIRDFDETVWISLEWANPVEFPRKMKSSNVLRFQDLECEM